MDSFVFNDDGSWEFNFPLARLPKLDWLNGNSHDHMHTSLLGTVTLEIGLSQYMFIVNRGYYSRLELNQTKLEYKGLPPGAQIPDFGKYIEEGKAGKKPDPNGRAKFSASQARAWLEHGTSIMELLFAKKARRHTTRSVSTRASSPHYCAAAHNSLAGNHRVQRRCCLAVVDRPRGM